MEFDSKIKLKEGSPHEVKESEEIDNNGNEEPKEK